MRRLATLTAVLVSLSLAVPAVGEARAHHHHAKPRHAVHHVKHHVHRASRAHPAGLTVEQEERATYAAYGLPYEPPAGAAQELEEERLFAEELEQECYGKSGVRGC